MARPLLLREKVPQRSFKKDFKYRYIVSIELPLKIFTLGIKLLVGEKYNISEVTINDYAYQLNLTVRRLDKSDFGPYTCSAENAFGKTEGSIRLQGTVATVRINTNKLNITDLQFY